MAEYKDTEDVLQKVLQFSLYAVIAVALLGVLRSVVYLGLMMVDAYPTTTEQTAMYIVNWPSVATSTLPATTMLSYALRNGASEDELFYVEGVVTEEGSATSTTVFVRSEYLVADQTREFTESFMLRATSSSLEIVLRDQRQKLHFTLYPPD